MKASDPVDYNKSVFAIAKWPLVLYGVLGLVYAYNSKFSWFSYHPLCMVIAFISLAGNAALIKKIGGYDNTKKHGYMMIGACAIGGFGWYVIYTNKIMGHKQHLTTLHGKLGILVLIGYALLGVFGAVALNPDWGVMRTNKTLRFAHKWSGRVLTFVAWTTCVLGFVKMYPDVPAQAAFTLPLLILGYFTLL